MELAIGARSVLRLLLTLAMLYSGHVATGHGVPGSDMGETLMDDEDVNIGEKRTGVQFTLDMVSKITSPEGCFNINLQEAVKKQIRTKLIADLQEDCKCQPSEGIINRDKFECVTESIVRYSGEIPEWTSKTYSVEQLIEFINSWRVQIEVDGGEINFAGGSNVKFIFNITNSQSNIEDFGSGDGMDIEVVDHGFGSGDIVTIDISIPGEEDNRNTAKVGGLDDTSGELRVRAMGSVLTLFTAFAILLSFV